MKVVLLSCELYLPAPGDHPGHADPLVHMLTGQIHEEDRLLEDALKPYGVSCERVAWSDADYDWASADLVVFRTPWDYMNRYPEFSAWLEEVTPLTQFLNPLETIHWNLDKHYLQDLEKSGIRIVPTLFAEKNASLKLEDWHQQAGWTHTVLKPSVSAGGRHTYRLNPGNRAEHEAIFQELLAEESWMLQPFLNSVVDHGEWSAMVFNGQFSHAVLKNAKPGDFRVQDDFGGTVKKVEASAELREFAEAAARVVSPVPAYARVDVVLLDDSSLAISELELFEPELWMRFEPSSAKILAEAVQQALTTTAP